MDGFNADRAAWVIVTAYAVALVLVARAWHSSAPDRERLFWALAAAAVLALGLNKQLDLQTQLTAMARQVARDGDWFQYRRQVQAGFIAALALFVAALALWLGYLVRGMGGPVKLALAGLVLLFGFVLLRAASFHHLDVLLRTGMLGTRAWVVIELGGILMVSAGAGWAIWRRQRVQPAAPI